MSVKSEYLEFGLQSLVDPNESTRPKAYTKVKKTARSGTNTKTIKAPGTTNERVAQACDRCRAKKTKCDGKSPCSGCASVGFECIVSDKLSRRAFPKGYTETLEERIRQLETENKKLVGLLDIRDEQLDLLNKPAAEEAEIESSESSSRQQITSSNLSLLESENTVHKSNCPCGCSNPNAVHERPVSLIGSVFDGPDRNVSIAGSINLSDDEDNYSLLSAEDFLLTTDAPTNLRNPKQFNFSNREVKPAPGAFAAATAIAQMQKNKVFQQQQEQLENVSTKQELLTSLVAISMPRSTEETLFIPTLLARICQVHGYRSKAAILTANSFASLKETANEPGSNDLPKQSKDVLMKMVMNRTDTNKLSETEATLFIRELINLPTSRMDLDHLITVYIQEWRNVLPIIDKNSFLKNYVKLTDILELGVYPGTAETESSYELIENFGAIMVLILSLSLLSNKHSHMSSKNTSDEIVGKYVSYLNHYDYLIHEFIKPNCIITKFCSIQSLQVLSLALQYCLVIGDVNTCYELRGRVITMAQQLRLHRCPAAVLGISGTNGDVNLRNFMQGERRILFWCVYCLDIYSSLNLGIPRLLKDFEIECAMPFSGKNDDEDVDNENIVMINDQKLSIVGKVSNFALAYMLYCKVLGNILDSLFSRSENSDSQGKALHRDRMLDCWRRELPPDLKFEIDVNGFSLKDNNNSVGDSVWKNYNKQQITLIFLYYHAKILIYLPIMSKHGNHHNVGLSIKEQLHKGKEDVTTVVSSISMIQQASIQILEVLRSIAKYSSSYLLPIPMNIAREQARFSLLVAKGTLDYIRGGSLYQSLKQLLLDTIKDLTIESSYDIPSSLTRNSVKLIELSILSILGLDFTKSSIRKKSVSSPITKTAVSRGPFGNDTYNKSPLGKINSKTTSPSTKMSVAMSSSDSSDGENFPFQGFGPMQTETEMNIDDEGLADILKFDPFKMTMGRQMFMNEFAADGSLGLVPFLGDVSDSSDVLDLQMSEGVGSENMSNENESIFDWMYPK